MNVLDSEIVRMSHSVVNYGISFGTALAIVISFNKNQSVVWAMIHGFFSWFYVIYYLIFKKKICQKDLP